MSGEEPWPGDRLFRLDNFGHSIQTVSYVFRPTHPAEVAGLFERARARGFTVGLRGAGRSYGDAALNAGQVVLDMRGMSRVLAWDPETGVITVEPGITIEQLWNYTLGEGWWPPVVPGTMFPTLGGCLASNVHGKNNWRAGTLGEHVLEFTARLPNGEEVTCTPEGNEELFYAMIGGMGMLGAFTAIKLQMKRVYSGYLDVYAWTEPNLKRALEGLDAQKENDYVVGWVDTTAGGRKLGRAQLHKANYLAAGEDPYPAQSLCVDNQTLPPNILGLVPRSIVPKILRLGMNNLGAWAANTGKYLLNRTVGNRKRYRQSFAEFNFLLDYVPEWERAYGKGGMIQYQSFLPKETAPEAYGEMLRLCKRRGLPSYLGVLKRHRPDRFLLSHAVDGYSVALDFKVTDRNRERLQRLTSELNEIVLEGGGRFYFAKDSTLTAEAVERFLGRETVERFKALKAKADPECVLQTDLYRRCFGGGGF